MPYSFLTYAQAKQALAQRLYDSGKQFFVDAELGSYVLESLQTFNALARFYRQDLVFNSSPNATWYDLTAQPLRAMTTTDQSILNTIAYHLLEPQLTTYPLIWAGSAQFALSDILSAIQQIRDQVLSETGCTVTQSLIAAALAIRTALAGNVMELRRVCWLPVAPYTPNLLMPSDIWSDQSFESGLSSGQQGIPNTFRRSTSPPLSFDVDKIPPVAGQYDILTVNGDGTLSPTTSTILPIPNDWTWVLTFGAMAQLLSRESSAQDNLRAQYSAIRFKQGVAAMRSAPALLSARLNDIPVVVETLTNADYYRANWQGLTPGSPDSIYYAGLNMMALAPQPTTNLFSVTASVLANMTLPVLDSDFIQVGRDDIAAVLDYAQHLAMFKRGGAEFLETFPLYENFIRHCALYNSKLSAQSLYLEFIDLRSRDDERVHPMFTKPDPSAVK